MPADVTAAPTRRRKWSRRRTAKAPVAAADDTVPAAAAESVPEQTPAVDRPASEETTDQPTQAADEPADEPADGQTPAQDTETTEETPLAQRKPVTGPVRITVAAAAVLFVAAAAFAGAMLQPYLADRALVNTKLDIARTAANAISTLWTYTPDDMDKLPDRSAKYLSGEFQDQYRKYVDAIAPTNKQAQVSNSTQVMGAAVETLEGPNATAVVYTNTTYTSPVTKNIPSLRYLSYRLVMERKNARWLITKMTTITSVDLTPKLGG
ncbi:MAG: hypothetical protein JO330_15310 [Mycobacteriaceae bacterium]|nr:hypothetical protein [Mycobacteriaceae bacterium]